MARFASQKRHTTSIMHRFKFRLTCRAKDALFMHRAIMSSMDQVLLLCPRPLISLYVSIWASPLDLWYPRPRFRAWTGAGSAGGYNAPGLPEREGTWSGWNIMSIAGGENAGAFQSHWEAAGSIASATKEAGVWDRLLIKASRSNPLYGSSTTVMPASVNLPVILYLGISA